MNQVFLLRCNGALIEVFSTEPKAVAYMRQHRKNSEHWRIARLEQGGQSAAVSILRHHFEQKGNAT